LSFESDPDTSVCIRRYPSRGSLNELALVLTAVGVAHRIDFDGHDWCLWVALDDVEYANSELARYQQENRPPSSAGPVPVVIDSGWLGVLGYLLVIWSLPWFENQTALGVDWRDAGVMDAARVGAGEWWRAVTALTLHGDIGHLVGNSLFGAVFGLFVGRHLGSGLGWLLVLAGGVLGNLANASIQPDGFRSLGASTATFAALALVGAFVWRRGYLRGAGWRRRLAPVFGGIALLAYTGFGGENTDVVAHVTGFVSGLLLGIGAAAVDIRRLGVSGQVLCGVAALALIGAAWSRAL
jgi:rhomboid protease GluP